MGLEGSGFRVQKKNKDRREAVAGAGHCRLYALMSEETENGSSYPNKSPEP